MKLEVVLVEPSKKTTVKEDRTNLIDYILLLKNIKMEFVNKT